LTSVTKSLSVSQKNRNGTLWLEAACLELAEVSLGEKIYELGLNAKGLGLTRINILPMLLATGVHLQVDIPREVAEAQIKLGTQVQLNICSHLGSYPGLMGLIAQQYQGLPQEGRILLAHGSRLNAANQEVEQLAAQAGAIAAYSFISPSVEMQVKRLIKEGKQLISILPYVLFPGKITDAIALEVEELAQQFPQINFSLGQPLGATQNLAQIITEKIQYEHNLYR
jgi:sirohydrochlorin ferrochelatase